MPQVLDSKTLQGSLVALITPFSKDGSVDYEALAGLIDFHLDHNTKALVILGTTGESSTMSHEEDNEVCRFTVERVAGRIPVIAGSGSNSTQTMLEKSLSFQEMGVDGLLIITPYYNKSNTEGIYQHFKTVLDAVEIPCILYNVPGRTGCSIPVSVVERLASHPNALGIKEASGSIQYATSIAPYISENFLMFSGNDDMVVPLLSLGASGVISVWANVMPDEVQAMVDAWFAGDLSEARRLQLAYLDLVDALFCEVNPIPVKAAAAMMGLCKEQYRLPLVPLSDAGRAQLTKAMQQAHLV